MRRRLSCGRITGAPSPSSPRKTGSTTEYRRSPTPQTSGRDVEFRAPLPRWLLGGGPLTPGRSYLSFDRARRPGSRRTGTGTGLRRVRWVCKVGHYDGSCHCRSRLRATLPPGRRLRLTASSRALPCVTSRSLPDDLAAAVVPVEARCPVVGVLRVLAVRRGHVVDLSKRGGRRPELAGHPSSALVVERVRGRGLRPVPGSSPPRRLTSVTPPPLRRASIRGTSSDMALPLSLVMTISAWYAVLLLQHGPAGGVEVALDPGAGGLPDPLRHKTPARTSV